MGFYADMMALTAISIHALLAESDIWTVGKRCGIPHFYPRSPCGERLSRYRAVFAFSAISIHALLAESDLRGHLRSIPKLLFLSTLSLRRATVNIPSLPWYVKYFYPRSPCGERLHYDNYNLHCVEISIHALLAESDAENFSSGKSITISIHALLAESDPLKLGEFEVIVVFLSTLSLRRATDDILAGVNELLISIHALLAESDMRAEHHANSQQEFLSTLSLRRATVTVLGIQHRVGISIHALLAESDEQ